jgi:hypothetical protein
VVELGEALMTPSTTKNWLAAFIGGGSYGCLQPIKSNEMKQTLYNTQTGLIFKTGYDN